MRALRIFRSEFTNLLCRSAAHQIWRTHIALNTKRFSSPKSEFSPGPAPFLEWIDVDKLVVDVTYQREIGRRGALNVNQIAENFDWSKFAPVIVAPVEGGHFAIVDRQHRTTAAILRSQEKVPCQVVQADRAKPAAAYAAVTGNITKTTAQQLYHAKLAAKDTHALALADVCAAAGVEILRKNLIRSDVKVGQTHAVSMHHTDRGWKCRLCSRDYR